MEMCKEKELKELLEAIGTDFENDSAKMFALLLMLPMINTKTWQFEEYIHNSEMKDLAEYIESSRPFKNLFSCSVQPESSYNEKPNEE